MSPKHENYVVYKAVCPRNRVYIGITKYDMKVRKYMHYRDAFFYPDSDNKFYKAIRKYDDQFQWSVLKTNLSHELAIKYEEYFIKKFDCFHNGYNSTLGGKGFGRKFSNRAIKKLSDSGKKFYKLNPEFRQMVSERQKKKFSDPENILKHKELMKQTHGTKEARIRNSRSQGGKSFNCYNFVTKEFVKTYEIIADAVTELGLPNGKISYVLKGKRNFVHTYIFKYLDDPSVNGTKYNPIWDEKIKRKPNENIRKKETKIT